MYIIGNGFTRLGEILKDVVGVRNQKTTRHMLKASMIQNGLLKLRVREEKHEITTINSLLIKINGVLYRPYIQGKQSTKLAHKDNQAITLRKGQSIEVTFHLPKNLPANAKIELLAHGYYEPHNKMLDSFLRNLK